MFKEFHSILISIDLPLGQCNKPEWDIFCFLTFDASEDDACIEFDVYILKLIFMLHFGCIENQQ